MWILASDSNSDLLREQRQCTRGKGAEKGVASNDGKKRVAPDADGAGREEQRGAIATSSKQQAVECGNWWAAEPGVDRVVHGLADRVDRLRALGNGQVPIVAACAWRILKGE